MKIMAHAGAASFFAAAGSFLAAREVENGLIRDIAHKVLERDIAGAVLASVEDGGAVVGAAVQTPPRKIVLSHMPAGAGAMLAETVRAAGADLPAALGPEAPVAEFGRRWAELAGVTVTVGMRQNLYGCDRLVEPAAVPGAPRLARPDETALAADWTRRFVTEIGLSEEKLLSSETIAAEAMAADRLWWWDDGGPVAMTGVASDSGAACRLNLVFTRQDCRRRGYGAAIVAHVTRLCLNRGRYCWLYADADYPPSNRLYQRLGYRLVATEQEIQFGGDRSPKEAQGL